MEIQKSERILYLLLGTIVVLLVMNLGLFIQMRSLQQDVVDLLMPLRDSSNSLETLPQGFPAPGFDLVDTEGNEVSLVQFHGNNVLIIFTSPTCAACQAIYPVLKDFSLSHPDIELVMMSNGNSIENEELVIEYGYTFPVTMPTKEIAASYLITMVPFAYFVDADGLIVSGKVFRNFEQLEDLVYQD